MDRDGWVANETLVGGTASGDLRVNVLGEQHRCPPCRWQTASLKESRLMDLQSMVTRPRVLGPREPMTTTRGDASADGVSLLGIEMCTREVTHELKTGKQTSASR